MLRIKNIFDYNYKIKLNKKFNTFEWNLENSRTNKVSHPIYKKYVNKSKKYYAHDPNNTCSLGDVVVIEESKPLSRLKRWRVKNIQQKAVS